MSLLTAIPIVGQLLDRVFGVIDKAVSDKDLAVRLKSELQAQALQIDHSEFEKEIEDRANARALALEEAKTDVWIARLLRGTFRPVVGYAFVGIYLTIKISLLVMMARYAQNVAEVLSFAKLIWGVEDFAVMGGILGFYYGLRTREKKGNTA